MSVGDYYLTAESHAALMAESQKRREALAIKRAERVDLPLERRHGERRVMVDRRIHPMTETLDLAHEKARDRRFTGAPPSAFGQLP